MHIGPRGALALEAERVAVRAAAVLVRGGKGNGPLPPPAREDTPRAHLARELVESAQRRPVARGDELRDFGNGCGIRREAVVEVAQPHLDIVAIDARTAPQDLGDVSVSLGVRGRRLSAREVRVYENEGRVVQLEARHHGALVAHEPHRARAHHGRVEALDVASERCAHPHGQVHAHHRLGNQLHVRALVARAGVQHGVQSLIPQVAV